MGIDHSSSTGKLWRGPAAWSAGLALVLYAVNLWGYFVYDDIVVCRDDERLRQPLGWVRFFRESYLPASADRLWRPLPSLSYALEWRLYGATAWPRHALNILLHAVASAMVASLAWRLAGRRDVAYIAGLLFAVHPVHVEAVSYLVGRAETMCTIGVLGGLLLFFSRPLTVARSAAITGCFILAALSKEHGLLLAPMIGAWAMLRRGSAASALAGGLGSEPVPPVGAPAALSRSESTRNAGQWLLIFLCFSIFAYIAYRESVMRIVWEKYFLRWTVNPIVRSHGWDRLLVPFVPVGRYAALLIFPWRLSPDYGAAITDYRVHLDDPYWYLGLAAALGYLVALVIALRRRVFIVAGCLLCFAICYALISNFVYVIGTVMGERLIYLGSVFIVILMALAIARLPRRMMLGLMALLLSLGTLRTVTYAWRWNNALRLFHLSRVEHPRSVYLRVLEAEQLLLLARPQEAEDVLAEGRRLVPLSQNVWDMSSRAAKALGRDKLAQEYAIRAFELNIHPPQMDDR